MENKKTNTVAEDISRAFSTKSSKMSSLEYTAPHISIYEESNDPDSWCIDCESIPTTPVAPTPPLSSSSTCTSREPGSAPSTTPTSPHALSPDPDANAWEEDTDLFPQYSWLYPSEPNGTWLASALQRPSTAISSIDGTQIRKTLSEVGDAVSDRLTHALDGQDLPAMHDRALSYLTPSVSMPSLRQVSQGVDRVTDRVQESFELGRETLRRRGRAISTSIAEFAAPGISEDGEQGKDQFTFAAIMASRALDGLVKQGIASNCAYTPCVCKRRLEAALTLLFIFAISEGGYDAETLFATTPVWVADADGKGWQLKLDTGFVNVVAVEGGECVEEPDQLDVDFVLEK